MSEAYSIDGYSRSFEALGSRHLNVPGGVIVDVFLQGAVPDLGEVTFKGWKPVETRTRLINTSPFASRRNMPPLWERVISERDEGDDHLVIFQEHRLGGENNGERIARFSKHYFAGVEKCPVTSNS